MIFEGCFEVTGINKQGEQFFRKCVLVTADTLGKTVDGLVEASYMVRAEVLHYISNNRPDDYSMTDDDWYDSYLIPSYLNPYNPEATHGGGGKVFVIDDIVFSMVAVRDTHLSRIRNIPTSELPADKTLNHYFTTHTSYTNFLRGGSSRSMEEYRYQGFTGADYDEFVENMGADYLKMLQHWQKYTRHKKGNPLPVIIPKELVDKFKNVKKRNRKIPVEQDTNSKRWWKFFGFPQARV